METCPYSPNMRETSSEVNVNNPRGLKPKEQQPFGHCRFSLFKFYGHQRLFIHENPALFACTILPYIPGVDGGKVAITFAILEIELSHSFQAIPYVPTSRIEGSFYHGTGSLIIDSYSHRIFTPETNG